MKVGTKSLLFGVHQVFLHPLFVFVGWVKLYGWNFKKHGYVWWKVIVCIVIHDWGYWGCSNMDGKEGEKHQTWAADWVKRNIPCTTLKYWYLCLFHSRFHARKCRIPPSELCWADKVGSSLYPPWLWVVLARLTGELKEYMDTPKHKERIQETNPFKYFKIYRDKVVPDLLREHGVKKP